MPIPFTSSRFFIPSPKATTVAVLSLKTRNPFPIPLGNSDVVIKKTETMDANVPAIPMTQLKDFDTSLELVLYKNKTP